MAFPSIILLKKLLIGGGVPDDPAAAMASMAAGESLLGKSCSLMLMLSPRRALAIARCSVLRGKRLKLNWTLKRMPLVKLEHSLLDIDQGIPKGERKGTRLPRKIE